MIRQRLMMQQTLQEKLAFKEMQKQQEKEEEEAFRKTTMAKFAEDDRIEQMNDRKQRMKQLEHFLWNFSVKMTCITSMKISEMFSE
ncbi:mannosyl-oligosaccharide alpha-1,2-mannosidase [Ataeniobius toweri]|uniref:Meiosis-specific nuclear structural protein 1 n=1 Tax=Ataeniobius toweri TaxID=208326 RepID=A0ABU7CIG8_9TELE|nr:mannosyl-oligosaccharide alpha-1,2-mannosidase [Ataeniobius toweri]